MNASEKDLKDMLVSAGVVTFLTDFFIGRLPDSPDDCAAIRTYTDNDIGGIESNPLCDVRVQLLARGSANQAGYEGSYAQSVAIKDELNMTVGKVQNGVTYTIRRLNGPSRVGDDERGRPLWSTNFRVWRSPV